MCNKMSDVRLSNASPTLERVDPARIIGLMALDGGASRPPVRRNLFGSSPADLEDFQQECRAQMAEEQRRFAERWSYDVVADRPLADVVGGCEWEEVSDAPEFYCRAPRGERRPRPADFTNGNGRNRGGGGGGGGGAERASPCRGGSGDSSPDDDGSSSPRRRRQRASSGPCSGDSPRKRRRYGDEEDDEDDEEDQSNCTRSQTLTSVEETPSKADSREQLG